MKKDYLVVDWLKIKELTELIQQKYSKSEYSVIRAFLLALLNLQESEHSNIEVFQNEHIAKLTEDQKIIIAFIGRGGSGKDYQCKLLKGFTELSFADDLRVMTAMIARVPFKQMIKIYSDFKSGDIFPNYTGRELMENIGSAVRYFDEDFWVNSVLRRIRYEQINKVCISDMRYINEYHKIKEFAEINDYEFKTFFCDYHSDVYQEHNEHDSAQLANYFATNSYKDLQELTEEDFAKFERNE